MVVYQKDEVAFGELYRAYAARVYRFCLSQLRNPTDAEDVAAEVFASAFAAYHRLDLTNANVGAWLMAIARNAVVDHARRDRRRRLLHFVLQGSADERNPRDVEHEVVLRDELRQVLRDLAKLKPRDRMLIGLRVAAQQSYAEIGEVVGLSEHAATMATRRAMERLRSLSAQGGES